MSQIAMTTRRRFLMIAASVLIASSPAFAQQDAATRSVVRQLEGQGFAIESVRSTLLGRVRVVARRGDLQRELVFDPRNGSILRDYTVDDGGSPTIGPSPDRGTGSSEGGGFGRDDDDDGPSWGGRDDDDDDGGSGGGGSGGGGGGSGGGGGGGGGSSGGGGDEDDDDDEEDDDDDD